LAGENARSQQEQFFIEKQAKEPKTPELSF